MGWLPIHECVQCETRRTGKPVELTFACQEGERTSFEVTLPDSSTFLEFREKLTCNTQCDATINCSDPSNPGHDLEINNEQQW